MIQEYWKPGLKLNKKKICISLNNDALLPDWGL